MYIQQVLLSVDSSEALNAPADFLQATASGIKIILKRQLDP